jgi:hypothetical protein
MKKSKVKSQGRATAIVHRLRMKKKKIFLWSSLLPRQKMKTKVLLRSAARKRLPKLKSLLFRSWLRQISPIQIAKTKYREMLRHLINTNL